MSTDHATETFLPIEGFPGYRVSSLGRIQSCIKLCGVAGAARAGTRAVLTDEWKDLALQVDKRGYLRISFGAGGKLVHRLVLQAFVGPCPAGMQTRHLNGQRQDNRIENLAWGTPAENTGDKFVHGTQNMGANHGRATLTDPEVIEIRRLHMKGWKQRAIAAHFRVHHSTIGSIVTRDTWKHL